MVEKVLEILVGGYFATSVVATVVSHGGVLYTGVGIALGAGGGVAGEMLGGLGALKRRRRHDGEAGELGRQHIGFLPDMSGSPFGP